MLRSLLLLSVLLGAATARADDETRPRPGGAFDKHERDCGPAHDHCLRGPWFLERSDGPHVRVTAVFEADHRWWSWQDRMEEHGEAAVRTRAATVDDFTRGAPILLFRGSVTRPPRTEGEAHGNGWDLVTVYSVDAKDRTFKFGPRGSASFSIDLARAIVETRPLGRAKETP